jgi:Methyltransferase domain
MAESQTNSNDDKEHEPSISCRLCGGQTSLAWTDKLLGRYQVGYYRCGDCESLMTERPYWIEEAYRNHSRLTDVAAAGRVEQCRVLIFWLWKLLGFGKSSRLLDWGGGDGLLVRKLRDDGINALLYDNYTKNNYANGFEGNPNEHYDIITAFEVWEHLIEPATDLQSMFGQQPDLLMISTQFYVGQSKTWLYLAAWSGRHVFFWSPKALRKVGEMFGYEVIVGVSNALFYRPQAVGRIRRWMLRPWLALRGAHVKRFLWVMWPKRSLRAHDKAVMDRHVENIAADA